MAPGAVTDLDAMKPTVWRDAITSRLAAGATLLASRYGGQLLSWCEPNGGEILYLSSAPSGADGKATGGGVPVYFAVPIELQPAETWRGSQETQLR